MKITVRFAPLIGIALSLLLGGCVTTPLVPFSHELDPLVFDDPLNGGLKDGRARFREIFCAINADHGEHLPDYRPCEEALVRVGAEPPPTGVPVSLARSEANFLVLMVPGLAHQCVKSWLDYDYAAPIHNAGHDYDAELLEVDGLADSESNARQIRDYIAGMPEEKADRPLVMIGFSKGAPDIMEALVRYPEVARKVVAMVAYAGAVGGSLLADDASTSQLNLLSKIPRAECREGDGGALNSLSPEVRQAWLEENTLPQHIRYYSIVSFPEPGRISLALKPSWRKLSERADARNDSQLVFYDQVLPGSSLLAFANADHWAMAIPVARQRWLASKTFATQSDFPREIMLESVLRYIEEDLSSGKPSQ